MNNINIKGHILAFFTIFVWATTFVSTKILLVRLTPIQILFIRFILGYLILLIIYPHFLNIKNKKDEILFALAGLTGITLYFLFENIGLKYTLASNGSIIISTVPFFTAILSAVAYKEKSYLNVRFFCGFVISMVGIYLISLKGSGVHINIKGDFLILCAAFVWAIYSVITKKISTYGYNILAVTRRFFLYGIMFMIPFFIFTDFSLEINKLCEPVVVFNLLFLGILASAICFVTWNTAVKILGPVKASVYIYIQPAITIFFSYIFLKERLTVYSSIGAVLTIIGLVLSERKHKY